MISRYYTNKLRQPDDKKLVSCDPQGHRVYKMEREIVGGSINTHMSIEALRNITNHACRKLKVAAPKVRVVRSSKRLFGWCNCDGRIYLNKKRHGDNLGVLLHELAHWVVWVKCPEAEAHGPEFMGCYTDLMAAYKVLPKDCAKLLASRYGVVIGEYK